MLGAFFPNLGIHDQGVKQIDPVATLRPNQLL